MHGSVLAHTTYDDQPCACLDSHLSIPIALSVRWVECNVSFAPTLLERAAVVSANLPRLRLFLVLDFLLKVVPKRLRNRWVTRCTMLDRVFLNG